MATRTKNRPTGHRRGGESQEQHEERLAWLFRGAKTPLEIMEVSAQILRENDAAARRVIDTGKQERDALKAQIERLEGHIKTLQEMAEAIALECDAKDEFVTGSQQRFEELVAINSDLLASIARDAVTCRDAFRLQASYGDVIAEYAGEGDTPAVLHAVAEMQQTAHQMADSYALRIPGVHTALMDADAAADVSIDTIDPTNAPAGKEDVPHGKS